jgi:hypothetical protein
MKLFRTLYNIKAFDEKSTDYLVMNDGDTLKAIFLPDSNFKEIILLNRNFGKWTYKKQENPLVPLNITFEKDETQFIVDICAVSEIHLDILKPEAVIVLRCPQIPPIVSRWSADMFDMILKLLANTSEEM